MGITYKKPVPTPEQIREEYKVPQHVKELKAKRDQEIKDVIAGKDDRFLVIIGPCSADREDSVLDYLTRLAKVNEKVSDKLIIIPRVYTNKPRTTGEGYKGMVHQPDPEQAPDLLGGLKAIRELHIKAADVSGMTCADEMLYPENFMYLDDILSYVAVGARSVENQQHRLVVSGMDIAAGMKNPTSGGLGVMLNSVLAGQIPQEFLYRQYEVHTDGNPYAHCILRGAVNKYGASFPNYYYEDLLMLSQLYAKRELQNPAAVVDANHANSNKKFKEQIRIVHDILNSRKLNGDINKLVKGVMIESYIEEGNQPVGGGCYGKSITDPCLGWDDTERLLLEIAEKC
jgi:3-deoxy-7-phosphoheptulonate synthase